jgi:hypothetical protein
MASKATRRSTCHREIAPHGLAQMNQLSRTAAVVPTPQAASTATCPRRSDLTSGAAQPAIRFSRPLA